MMKHTYLYIRSLMIVLAILSFSACSDDNLFGMDGEKVSLVFHPTLGDVLGTRAIGDATGIDQLVVSVYEGSETKSKLFSQTYDWASVQSNGVSLTLIEGRTYHILFWAEHKDNRAYSISDDGHVGVSYDNYLNGGFGRMEALDAFYNTTTVTVGAQKEENKGEIKLSRPLAQINFADNTTQPVSGSHRAVVTFHGMPASFNPFTGEIAMTQDDVCFTFTDFPNECLTVDGTDYYYLASNYVFAPHTGTTSLKATLDLQNAEGATVKQVVLHDIGIAQNKRTNILGAIVQQPETWSVWNGTIPSSSTITVDAHNRYIIDEAADIAWLGANANTLATGRTFVMTKDIDMANLPGLSAIQLPQGSILDGNGHTIKGLKLTDGLLGDAMQITVQHLNVEDVNVTNTSSDKTHVGVLANSVKGSSTFSNIYINNASVNTQNGAAGGIVGYVSRKDANNRNERLTVTFDDCHIEGTNISGTLSEGYLVGLLRGYDNGETLQFNPNCTRSETVYLAHDYVSLYREGNEGVWLAANDYSIYNGWLGDEECYRGKVMYGNNRFIPCWDGSTKITPLTDGSTKLIYSAFDLAALQGTAAGDIQLMENVCMEYDLDGASKDGVRTHTFTPLSTLNSLEGNGKTIYNISIRGTYYSGFVYSESCATTFQNVNFDGADIRVTHDADGGNAYVGTLRGFAYANTTIDNVHVRNGYLYGVNKMGGLCGGIFSTVTCTNSSVQNYSIENYDSQIVDAGFKANGEIGGLIGFIQVLDAATVNEISNCYVKNNAFNCFTYSAALWDRSVAPFIGDIRTSKAGRVNISSCSIQGTNTYTNATTGVAATFDQHKKKTGGSIFKPVYTYYPLIGQCYNVIIQDTKGSVYIDGTQVF